MVNISIICLEFIKFHEFNLKFMKKWYIWYDFQLIWNGSKLSIRPKFKENIYHTYICERKLIDCERYLIFSNCCCMYFVTQHKTDRFISVYRAVTHLLNRVYVPFICSLIYMCISLCLFIVHIHIHSTTHIHRIGAQNTANRRARAREWVISFLCVYVCSFRFDRRVDALIAI